MKCSKIKKGFIAYIDGELESKKKKNIEKHLEQCAECRRELAALKKIYFPTHEIKPVKPAPFLWNQIYSRIRRQEKMASWQNRVNQLIPQIAMSAAVMLLFLSAILFGIYLGSSSISGSFSQQQLISDIAPEEELVRDAYLDAFDTIPPQSIAGIYFSLQTENAQTRNESSISNDKNLRD